jgi:hypothetical protein
LHISTMPRKVLLMTGVGPPDWATTTFLAIVSPPYRNPANQQISKSANGEGRRSLSADLLDLLIRTICPIC